MTYMGVEEAAFQKTGIARDKVIWKILETIFVEGPLNIYQIEKKTGFPHATVHKKVKAALEAGLLEVASESRFRTGLTSKVFQLTREALYILLSETERPPESFLKPLSKLAVEDPDLRPALKWFHVFVNGSKLLKDFYLDSFQQWEDRFPRNVLSLFSEWSQEDYERFGDADHLDFLSRRRLSSEEKEALKSEITRLLKANETFRNYVFERIRAWRDYYIAQLRDIEKVEENMKKALEEQK